MSANKKVKIRGHEKIKVLIADDDWPSSRRTQDFLVQNGFECRMVHSGAEVKKAILTWLPKVVLIDLLLPEGNAFEILGFIANEPSLAKRQIAVLVMSGHNSIENIQESYQRGAKDYLARPIMYQDLLKRLVFHCRDTREIDPTKETDANEATKMADLILNQALQNTSLETVLFDITKTATLKVRGLRCSIVRHITHEKGIVLASNDRGDIAGLPLDLNKYPEIQLSIHTGKHVVIDNLDDSKALSRIKKSFKEINFNSMVVCPIYYQHKIFGVISMRMPNDRKLITEKDLHFIEFTSKIISLYISTQNPEVFGRYGLLSA